MTGARILPVLLVMTVAGGPSAVRGDEFEGWQLRDNVATSALPTRAEIAGLRDRGVTRVIDLRAAEDTAEERAAVTAAGLDYVNIPITRELPDADAIAAFSRALPGPGESVLIHCVSGKRAGYLWGAWRISEGVPLELALDEARSAGAHHEFIDSLRGAQADGGTP